MPNRKSFKTNLLAAWGEHALSLAIGAFLMPFVLGRIGDEQYGTWIFLNSIAGYSGLFYLGFGQTISRFVAAHHARGEHDRLNEAVTAVLAVYLCMAGLVLAIAGVLAWLAPALNDWGTTPLSEVRWVILILGLNVAVGFVGSVFGGVLMGVQRFDLDASVAAIGGVLRLVLTVIVLNARQGLIGLALVYLAITLLENLSFVLLAHRKVPQLSVSLRHFRGSVLRECFSFSTYGFVHALSAQLIEATDSILIGLVYGPRAIVPYAIAQRLCQFISKPMLHVGTIALPRAGELHANVQTQKLRELVQQGAGLSLLLTAGMFVGAAFFASSLIQNWVGPGYEESYILLLILLGGRVVAAPISVLRLVLLGTGDVRRPALIYFLEALANFGLSLALVGPWGLRGVALGTLLPVVVIELGVFLPYALARLGLSLREAVSKILFPQVTALAALVAYAAAASAFHPGPFGWGGLILVSAGGGAILGTIRWFSYRQEQLSQVERAVYE